MNGQSVKQTFRPETTVRVIEWESGGERPERGNNLEATVGANAIVVAIADGDLLHGWCGRITILLSFLLNQVL